MTDKEKPTIAQAFRIESGAKQIGDSVYEITRNFLYQVVENWDNFCIDSLYKEYQKLGITDLFVINREEFKQFLLWALPEYYKRFKDEK